MNTVKSFLLGSLLLLAVVVGIGWLLPATYSVKISQPSECSQATNYELVNRLANWELWAFGEATDGVVVHYEGAQFGPGSLYTWQAGENTGRMEITASNTPQSIILQSSVNQADMIATHQFQFNQNQSIEWEQSGTLSGIQQRYLLAFGVLEKIIRQDMEEKLQRLASVCRDHSTQD